MDFANRLAKIRKQRGLTQEELADKLGVSGQAVSKWETGNSMPDVALLGTLAHTLNVTVDDLLGIEPKHDVEMVPPEQKKNTIIRIAVSSAEGDRVRINLPLLLVKAFVGEDGKMPLVVKNDSLKEVDFGKIIEMADQGLIGELMSVDSADGDHVVITVEP